MSQPPDISVLAERVTNMLDKLDATSNILSDHAAALNNLSDLRADIRVMNSHTETLCETLKSHAEIIADHSQRLQSHSTIWKICGTMLLACTGLVGWGYSTIQSLKESDNAAERRILSLEIEVRHMSDVSHETIYKNHTVD